MEEYTHKMNTKIEGLEIFHYLRYLGEYGRCNLLLAMFFTRAIRLPRYFHGLPCGHSNYVIGHAFCSLLQCEFVIGQPLSSFG